VSGYADGGDAPDKLLELVPGAVEESRELLATQTDTMQRFDRVAELVQGYETSFGLELLATVHWVAHRELHSIDLTAVIGAVRSWGPQKQKMTDRQIQLALDRLTSQGWLSVLVIAIIRAIKIRPASTESAKFSCYL